MASRIAANGNVLGPRFLFINLSDVHKKGKWIEILIFIGKHSLHSDVGKKCRTCFVVYITFLFQWGAADVYLYLSSCFLLYSVQDIEPQFAKGCKAQFCNPCIPENRLQLQFLILQQVPVFPLSLLSVISNLPTFPKLCSLKICIWKTTQTHKICVHLFYLSEKLGLNISDSLVE